MPYILEEKRFEELTIDDLFYVSRKEIGEMLGEAAHNGGELQYMLAIAINRYLKIWGLDYQNCQDIMGALAGAQAEFQRVVVGPYEQSKIEENDGIYTVMKEETEPDPKPESMKAAKELLTLVFGDSSPWRYGNVMAGVDELWVCLRPGVHITKFTIPNEYKGFKVIVKENWETAKAL